MEVIQQQELRFVSHAKTDSYALHDEPQKDTNAGLELTTMETSDVKPVNPDFSALMEKQQQKLSATLELGFDSTLLEEQVLVQFVLQKQNAMLQHTTLVLKAGTLNPLLKLVSLALLPITV